MGHALDECKWKLTSIAIRVSSIEVRGKSLVVDLCIHGNVARLTLEVGISFSHFVLGYGKFLCKKGLLHVLGFHPKVNTT